MKLYKNLCLIALFWLLSVLTVFGSPIDSVLQASADKFAAFVRKNQTNGIKNTKNPYVFNFDPVRDGTKPSLSEYSGGASVPTIYTGATNEYNILNQQVTDFNTNYDNANFQLYIFHGRYYVDTQTIRVKTAEMLVNDGTTGYNTISEDNKLKIFKDIYQYKNADNFILKNLSNRVYTALGSSVSGKRIIIIFAIETQLLQYNTPKEANSANPLVVSGASAPVTVKPYVHRSVFWSPSDISDSEKSVLEIIQQNTLRQTASGASYSSLNNPSNAFQNHVQSFSNDGILRAGLSRAVTMVTEGLMFQKKRNQIFTACSALQIKNALFLNASPTIYKLLTVDERIRLLELMVISNDVGIVFQKMVLDIFENVPKSQIDAFLTRLEGLVTANPTACAGTTNNQTRTGAIIVNLMNYLDDAHFLIGNNNYTSLMTKIIKLIENSPTFEQKAYNLLNNADFVFKNIVWKPKTSSTQDIGTIVADNIALSSSGEVSYNLKELVRFNVTPSPASILYAPVWTPFGTTNTLKPFDLVMFTNAGNLNIINESMQGTMRAVPAIFLQYAKNKTNVELFKDGIITTTCVAIDILTIYKGAPAFTAAKGLRRAYIGFEVANATANLVLNLSGTELQGTQFANLVKYSDYIMLGIGVKDLVRVTGKSVFPDLYKKAKDNVNQLNRQSIKYFLASYMRVQTQIKALANTPTNTSAKTVEEVYKAVFKEVDASTEGKALINEADALAKSGEDLANLGRKGKMFQMLDDEQIASLEPCIIKAVSNIKDRNTVGRYLNDTRKSDNLKQINEGGLFTAGDIIEFPAKSFLKKTINNANNEVFLSTKLQFYDANDMKIGGDIREIDMLIFNKATYEIEKGISAKLNPAIISKGITADRKSLKILKELPIEISPTSTGILELQNYIIIHKLTGGMNEADVRKIVTAKVVFKKLSTDLEDTLYLHQFKLYLDKINTTNFPIDGISPITFGLTRDEMVEGMLELIKERLKP